MHLRVETRASMVKELVTRYHHHLDGSKPYQDSNIRYSVTPLEADTKQMSPTELADLLKKYCSYILEILSKSSQISDSSSVEYQEYLANNINFTMSMITRAITDEPVLQQDVVPENALTLLHECQDRLDFLRQYRWFIHSLGKNQPVESTQIQQSIEEKYTIHFINKRQELQRLMANRKFIQNLTTLTDKRLKKRYGEQYKELLGEAAHLNFGPEIANINLQTMSEDEIGKIIGDIEARFGSIKLKWDLLVNNVESASSSVADV